MLLVSLLSVDQQYIQLISRARHTQIPSLASSLQPQTKQKMVQFAYRQALLAVSFTLIAIASADPSPGKATCAVQTRPDGPDIYVLSGVKDSEKTTFDCMAVENDDPPLTCKEVLYKLETGNVCNLEKKPKTTSYVISLVETLQKCKWECKPSTLHCTKTPKDGDKECDCYNTGPRPVIVPISEDAALQIFVQSATGNTLDSDLCAKKNLGDTIGAEVNCEAITKDYPEKSLQRIGKDMPICSYQENPKKDQTYTVFAKMLPGSTGMACSYVCKPDNTLKCGSGDLDDNEQCMCSNTGGLVPKLLPIDDSGVTRMVINDDGTKSYDAEGGCFVRNGVDSCGDCGKCVESIGVCVLKENNLYEKNVCPCGYICPRDAVISSRPAGSHGSPIMCEVNVALSKEPCVGTGTERPDMCLESSESDIADQCVCAKTHREVLGLEDDAANSTCVPIEE